MNENQKPKRLSVNEDAVSPVIGVILMVAITVVLAAVVFAAVSNLSKQQQQAPTVAFTGEDYGRAWVVTRADPGLLWSEFTVSGCTTVPTGTLDAGDSLTGCTPPVTVVHVATNTVVFRSGAA